MNPASNLIFIGPMGAGKTSIGRRVAERFGLDFVDADHYLEEHTGVAVRDIFELEGEPGFRRRESAALAELCAGHDQLIATGGGVVLDPGNRALLKHSGYVVWLRCSVDRQLERLAHDRARPLLAAPDRRQRLEQLARIRDPLYAECCDHVFESDQRRVLVAADHLSLALRERWQRSRDAA